MTELSRIPHLAREELNTGNSVRVSQKLSIIRARQNMYLVTINMSSETLVINIIKKVHLGLQVHHTSVPPGRRNTNNYQPRIIFGPTRGNCMMGCFILWHVDPLLNKDRERSSYTTAVAK
jgi:hypothetical protein